MINFKAKKMRFFKKEKVKLDINVERVSEESVTLVTKKISGKGKYRIYINEWKYNLRGILAEKELRHEISSSYFKKGENLIQVVVVDDYGNKFNAYETYFKVA